MKLIEKIAQFQKECPEITKNTKAFKGSYAKYEHIQSVIKPYLAKIGLVITHRVQDSLLVTDIIDIESDTNERLTSIIPLLKENAQDRGAEITYSKRYNVTALLDLIIEDPDLDDPVVENQATPIKSVKKNTGVL